MAEEIMTDIDAELSTNTGTQTPDASSADKGEGQGQTQTPNVESQPNANTDQDSDNGSDNAREVPFNENPRFKERITQIEQKYGSDARSWQMINEVAAEDPEFALSLIKKLEDRGKVRSGTYEAARKKLQPPVLKQNTQGADVNEDRIKQILDSHPDIQAARAIREEREAEAVRSAQEQENWLQNFEKDRPDIAKSQNPEMIRRAIAMEAQLLIQNEKLEPQDAFDRAYRWILHRNDVLEEYKQKGEITGRLTNAQESIATPAKGSSIPDKPSRRLDEEESRAAKLMGVSEVEYLKLISDPNSGMVE